MITMSKRVMSPRNIVANVIDCTTKEQELLYKAAEYFKSTCRATIGYKQLSSYIGKDIVIQPEKESVDLLQQIYNEFNSDYGNKVIEATLPTPQVEVQLTENISNETIKEINKSPTTVDEYFKFVNELYTGIFHKQTRRLDEIDIVIKAVWREHSKGLSVEAYKLCREFCIRIHKDFALYMQDMPSHWYFIKTVGFLPTYDKAVYSVLEQFNM